MIYSADTPIYHLLDFTIYTALENSFKFIIKNDTNYIWKVEVFYKETEYRVMIDGDLKKVFTTPEIDSKIQTLSSIYSGKKHLNACILLVEEWLRNTKNINLDLPLFTG